MLLQKKLVLHAINYHKLTKLLKYFYTFIGQAIIIRGFLIIL